MSAAPETSRAWPIVSLVILVILGAINLFVLFFFVPDFEQMYHYTLHGRQLPGITLFIMAARIPLAFIALAWSISGIVTVWKRHRAAIWIVNLGLLFFFALVWVTTVALLMPRVVFIAGMSDTSLTSPTASQ
jgi:hypothetical protein